MSEFIFTKPTDVLKYEHKIIEKALIVMDESVGILPNAKLTRNIFEKLIEFVQNFADKCHHAKEEDILFPFLVKKGMPKDNSPIGIMLNEHNSGREYIKQFKFFVEDFFGGKYEVLDNLKVSSSNYTQLLRSHIFKEDNILFKIADEIINPDECKLLIKSFEEAEEKLGKDIHEKNIAIISDLYNRHVKAKDGNF